jgi:RNA polymerase sigma factor (TIGR02999 family)
MISGMTIDIPERSEEITRLLIEMRNGNEQAVNDLIPLVYDHLRRLAKSLMRNERSGHTLQATALVNDALMRLFGTADLEWRSRAHFFAVAATVMRRILIESARAHRAEKRFGNRIQVSLDSNLAYEWRQAESLLMINEALGRLNQIDPRLCKVVEMRFFAGMTEADIAEVLNVSARTVKRDWQFAKHWLYREMTKR